MTASRGRIDSIGTIQNLPILTRYLAPMTEKFIKQAKTVLRGLNEGLHCIGPLVPTPLDIFDMFDDPEPVWDNPNTIPILTPFGVVPHQLDPGDYGYRPMA